MSLSLELPNHTEAQLRALARQRGVSAEAYAAQLLESSVRQRELAEASEAQLLQRLGLGFSEQEWERYHRLVESRQEERLNAEEQRKLLALRERLEAANAARMGVLVELAKRRGVGLEQVMREVGIVQPGIL